MEEASQARAERQFKLLFILEKIAEKEKVFATENDLENEIGVLASNYRVRPARMRAELQRRRMLSELRIRIRERKTIDLLLSKANVVETTPASADEPAEPQKEPEAPAGQKPSEEAAGDAEE